MPQGLNNGTGKLSKKSKWPINDLNPLINKWAKSPQLHIDQVFRFHNICMTDKSHVIWAMSRFLNVIWKNWRPQRRQSNNQKLWKKKNYETHEHIKFNLAAITMAISIKARKQSFTKLNNSTYITHHIHFEYVPSLSAFLSV